MLSTFRFFQHFVKESLGRKTKLPGEEKGPQCEVQRLNCEFSNKTSYNNRVDIVKYNVIFVNRVGIVDIVGLCFMLGLYFMLEIIVYGRELERIKPAQYLIDILLRYSLGRGNRDFKLLNGRYYCVTTSWVGLLIRL